MVERTCKSLSWCHILQWQCERNHNQEINPWYPPAAQAKTEIGALGMPITIPPKTQAAEIHKKEQNNTTKPYLPHRYQNPAYPSLLTNRTQSLGPKSLLLTNPHLKAPSPPLKLMKTTKQHWSLGASLSDRLPWLFMRFINPFFGCRIQQSSNKHNQSPQTISKPIHNLTSRRQQPIHYGLNNSR